MRTELLILLLEDVDDDAALIVRALRAGGIVFKVQRARAREDYLQALHERCPDVILADIALSTFDGKWALELAGELRPGTPVIIVTGSMPDQAAVELLREGAADYILKDRLSRLAPAVRRALDQADEAQRRQAAEAALKNSELRYRRLFETSRDGILILDGDSGRIVDANQFLLDLVGYTREELFGNRVSEFADIDAAEPSDVAFLHLQRRDYVHHEHLPLLTRSGTTLAVEVIGSAYRVDDKKYIQYNIREIGERLAAQRLLNEQLEELRQFQRVTVDRELRLQELEMEVERLRRAKR